MMRSWRDEAIFVTLLILGVAGMLWAGAYYPYDVSLFPYVMGVPTLIILVLIWLMAMRRRPGGALAGAEASDKKPAKGGDFTGWGAMLNTLSWIVSYAVLIFLIGFIVATPLFLLVFFKKKSDLSLVRSLIASALSSLVIIRFVMAFTVELWLGALPEIWPGVLGGSIIPPL